MQSNQTRARIAIVASVFLGLWGAVQYVDKETAYQRQSPDPFGVAAQEERLAGLRAAVPAEATLGYVTDVPLGETLGSSMFYVAQYHLAPRLLQKGSAYDLVLGNFTRPGDYGSVGRQQGLRLERDFGSGVVLFRREARP